MKICNMIYREVLLLLILLFSIGEVNSQTGSGLPQVPKLEDIIQIPKSPEASAFAKYGNTPVSHFSGIPNISVPIGQLNGRDITIPIELTYDGSGIRVDQIASDVGLGWNLKVGGMIVRNVKGLPDDYSSATPGYYPFDEPIQVIQDSWEVNKIISNDFIVKQISSGLGLNFRVIDTMIHQMRSWTQTTHSWLNNKNIDRVISEFSYRLNCSQNKDNIFHNLVTIIVNKEMI